MSRRLDDITKAVTSPSTATPSVTTIAEGLGAYDEMEIEADLAGATGDYLDVCIQRSMDGVDFSDWIRFKRLTAGQGALKQYVAPCIQSDDIVTVGESATAITIDQETIVGGGWMNALRVLCVPGPSTSAGAVLSFTLHAKEYIR